MKTTIMIVMGLLLGATSTFAASKLVKGEEFAQITLGSEAVTVYKVLDGATTCYVTKAGKNVYHAISCVK